jgi:hypothetical protein
MARNIQDSPKAWCSIYSASNFGGAVVAKAVSGSVGATSAETHCKQAFIMYNTDPPTYQACKWREKTDTDTTDDDEAEDMYGTCKVETKLKACGTLLPPSAPSPPLLPPSPSAPVLCPVLGGGMVSVRDLSSPKWCLDYASDKDSCEKAYIRMGQTFYKCMYSPVDITNTYAPSCTMDTTKLPCEFSPPSPPSPPAPPSSCEVAVLMGLTTDLRYYYHSATTKMLGHATDQYLSSATKAKHAATQAAVGDIHYADCGVYTQDGASCKHAYQTDGADFLPCIFRNTTGTPTCLASPTKRGCAPQ